jgi:hypothetical protein
VAIASSDNMTTDETGYVHVSSGTSAIYYSSAALTQFANGSVTDATSVASVADIIVDAIPGATATEDDPEYAAWFEGLMAVVHHVGEPPIAHEEGAIDPSGWKVGEWNDFVFYPHPPSPPPHDAGVWPG